MFVFIPIPASRLLVYVAAHQLLRPVLGAKCPTISDLIAMELTNRRAKTIAEEYLDLNGYLSLNTYRRKLTESRRAKAKTKSIRVLLTRRAARRPLVQGEPGRN